MLAARLRDPSGATPASVARQLIRDTFGGFRDPRRFGQAAVLICGWGCATVGFARGRLRADDMTLVLERSAAQRRPITSPRRICLFADASAALALLTAAMLAAGVARASRWPCVRRNVADFPGACRRRGPAA